MRGFCVVMLVGSALISSPAFAEGTQQRDNKKDPNEVVCEKQEEIGSRLSAVRVCKTRAEWAEERRLTRQDIERGQTQRGCNDRC
jgi:hypothetical protein